ncbi:MAG: DPP IV N-terminal domain-containing protein [Bryobacteraceae bacterium]
MAPICKKISKPTEHKPGLSPDGKWQAEVNNYNLYLRNTSTRHQIQLTTDGRKDWTSATPLPNSRLMVEQRTENVKQPPTVFWSPDSKRLVTYRIDSRHAGRFVITQHAPPFRRAEAAVTASSTPMPGEKLSTAAPIILDISTRKRTPVQMEPLEMFFQDGPSFRWLTTTRISSSATPPGL